ncbi:MAG: DMT family transporter [Alphaproteobacteria bacterium]|nr:DMT family transporter [Alphaproteobacteria bacterium]
MSDASRGLFWGFLGVAIFSLTLPFTHLAVREFDPLFISLGRTVVAAMAGGAILLITRQPWPDSQDFKILIVVGLGVILGFPVLSSLAMRTAPASHGSVVLGLLPLGTAFMSTIFAGEKPSPQFWLWSLLGSSTIVVYALWEGGLEFHSADVLLVLAVITASMGYAAGGALSRKLGGWQVICWALLLYLPITLPLAYGFSSQVTGDESLRAWACFGYLALMSQLVGFFAWNKGLAVGGVARVGQVQLLQSFMTQVGAWALTGEALTLRSLGFAGLVVVCVWFGRRAQVAKA